MLTGSAGTPSGLRECFRVPRLTEFLRKFREAGRGVGTLQAGEWGLREDGRPAQRSRGKTRTHASESRTPSTA